MAGINTPTPVHHVQQSLELNIEFAYPSGQSIWAESQCFILKWTLFSDFTQQSQFIALYFLKLQLSLEILSFCVFHKSQTFCFVFLFVCSLACRFPCFWSLCYSEHSDSLCTISERSLLKIFSTNSWQNNLTYDLLKLRLDLILNLWVWTCCEHAITDNYELSI